MNHQRNQIERLDWAARALAALPLFSWAGIVVLWYPLIKMWIWRDEARIVPHVATTHLWASIVAVAIIPTIMVLIRQSYAILVIAVVATMLCVGHDCSAFRKTPQSVPSHPDQSTERLP